MQGEAGIANRGESGPERLCQDALISSTSKIILQRLHSPSCPKSGDPDNFSRKLTWVYVR